jgi:RNA polymerase sigma-70 factor (ECF subfamily)
MYALADPKGIDSPRALLYRVAHNLAVERARRQISRATDSVADLELLGVSTMEAPPDDQIDARRRFEAFCAAVDRLPPLCRRVFVLRKVYKLSHAEIAEILHVSHSTIEKHVAKGLLRCRDYLKDQGMLESRDPGTADMRRRARDGGDAE